MSKCIFCVMITGKDDYRYNFVDIAIKNFKLQTYNNKKLLIINHGNKKLNIVDNNIFEININNKFMTLGDIRNYALTLIPYNCLWTTWDDDDWRINTYLELLYNELKDNDIIFIKNRLDYNLNNNFCYESNFKFGMPFFLSKKIEKIQYLQLNSLEDENIYNDYKKNNKKIKLLNNDPKIYIRIIHINNTSLYVDKNRDNIINYVKESKYTEKNVNKKDYNYVYNIINKEFYFFIKNNNE